jgi:hypothetical protein
MRAYIPALAVTVITIAVIYTILQAYAPFLSGLTTLEKASIVLGIINGLATIALTLVAYTNMRESKKVRSEMVRPHLALEPTLFEYDPTTGEIIGFNCLNLVNGGTVARDVEIDLSCRGISSLYYTSSIGTSDRVKIWSGQFNELGGNIEVAVRYKNMFNKNIQEVLSINIDSLKVSKRKLLALHNS